MVRLKQTLFGTNQPNPEPKRIQSQKKSSVLHGLLGHENGAIKTVSFITEVLPIEGTGVTPAVFGLSHSGGVRAWRVVQGGGRGRRARAGWNE